MVLQIKSKFNPSIDLIIYKQPFLYLLPLTISNSPPYHPCTHPSPHLNASSTPPTNKWPTTQSSPRTISPLASNKLTFKNNVEFVYKVNRSTTPSLVPVNAWASCNISTNSVYKNGFKNYISKVIIKHSTNRPTKRFARFATQVIESTLAW